MGADQAGQHVFQNILTTYVVPACAMHDPEPHHVVKCESTLLERFKNPQ
jgi:hypothetical protein